MKEISQKRIARRAFGGLATGLGPALALSACAGSDPLGRAPASNSPGSAGSGPALVIGSADFPESQILAEVYAGALNAAGVTATTKPNIDRGKIPVKVHPGPRKGMPPTRDGGYVGPWKDPAS